MFLQIFRSALQKTIDKPLFSRYNSHITDEKEQVLQASLHPESRRWWKRGSRSPEEWAFEGDPKGNGDWRGAKRRLFLAE